MVANKHSYMYLYQLFLQSVNKLSLKEVYTHMGMRAGGCLHNKLWLNNDGLCGLWLVLRVPARLLRDGGEAGLAMTSVCGRVCMSTRWRGNSTLGRTAATHRFRRRSGDAVRVRERHNLPPRTHQRQHHRKEEKTVHEAYSN